MIGNRNIIQRFPVISRNVINNFLEFSPAKYAYLTCNQSKEVGLLNSRQRLFFRFLKQLEMDAILSPVNPYSQTLIAIFYLSVLSKGYTCKDISVRKSTLQGYMQCVALYSMANCSWNILLNPDLNLPTSLRKEHQMIKLICDYQSHLKGPTNKNNPLTKRMITHIQERARGIKGKGDCF